MKITVIHKLVHESYRLKMLFLYIDKYKNYF